MKARNWVGSMVAVFAVASAAMGSLVEFDMTPLANWDGYISTAEHTEAQSYNPPADWGLANRMVKTVFGQHYFGQWSFGNRVFAWQNQVTSSYVGLPEDGKITAGTWTYQLLESARDAEPSGGWGNPEYAKPENPNGQLPTSNNVIYVYRGHSNIADPATAKLSVTLAAGDQGKYESINMLMHGNAAANRLMRIYAEYSDGQELLWTGNVPSPEQTLDPSTYPSHADLELAFTATRVWSNAGSPAYNTLATVNARLFQFSSGLTLDSSR